jgi:hypothetical protein
LTKKPGRAHGPGSGCLDAVPERPISGDHGDITIADTGLRLDSFDDRVIPRPLGVEDPQTPVLPGRDALFRGTLKDQDDLVIRQHGGRQLFSQPTSCLRAITPPTVRATAYDVGAIDDQGLHPVSVGAGDS